MLRRAAPTLWRLRGVGQRSRGITAETRAWADRLNEPLTSTDPELHGIMEDEKVRQRDSIVLIASENYTSKSVFDALGSVMSNKYSEGYPNQRYYGGNEHIDRVESLCQQRALDAFDLDPEKVGERGDTPDKKATDKGRMPIWQAIVWVIFPLDVRADIAGVLSKKARLRRLCGASSSKVASAVNKQISNRAVV